MKSTAILTIHYWDGNVYSIRRVLRKYGYCYMIYVGRVVLNGYKYGNASSAAFALLQYIQKQITQGNWIAAEIPAGCNR